MAPRRIVLAIVGVLLACAIAGVFADRWARARESAETQVTELARAGKGEGDEQRYWKLLQDGPVTVPTIVSFLEAHESAVDTASNGAVQDVAQGPERLRHLSPVPSVDEAQIEAFLARTDLPPDVTMLGRYWRSVVRDTSDPDLEKAVTRAADAEPPVPYANDLLGRADLQRNQGDEAAERLLREGTYFPERTIDVSLALAHWEHQEAWDRIDRALADPRIARLAPPWLQLRSAIRLRDWRAAAHAYPLCLRPPLSRGSVILALISALAWGVFCARLGGISLRPRVRLPLYLLAFVLGFASVSVTLVFVVLEEVFLKMTETGDPLRDLLFFTFGVGFREEVSKLLFFVPLLPLIRKYGSKTGARLDVLVCGALVGLGFAAEENLGYLHEGDLGTAMARFLTANFFHMSMTAILAGALDAATSAPVNRTIPGWKPRAEEDGSFRFSTALLTVAAMHGIYDFCLSERAYGNISYFSMGVFLLLTRQFLALVSAARARERSAHPRLLETFSFGMAIVVGSSFVYASALVGPGRAAAALAEGLLGLAIIIFIFVQELRRI
jgi:RsiW-degrading membrane proteinase PrsW (M82 family)